MFANPPVGATAQQITISGWLNLGQPVAAPNGDLWVSAEQQPSEGAFFHALLEITTSGQVVKVISGDIAPLAVGGNGALWFGQISGGWQDVGCLGANGVRHVFHVVRSRAELYESGGPLGGASYAPSPDLTSTVGPNGDIWFIAPGYGNDPGGLERITPSGQLHRIPGSIDYSQLATDSYEMSGPPLSQAQHRSPCSLHRGRRRPKAVLTAGTLSLLT